MYKIDVTFEMNMKILYSRNLESLDSRLKHFFYPSTAHLWTFYNENRSQSATQRLLETRHLMTKTIEAVYTTTRLPFIFVSLVVCFWCTYDTKNRGLNEVLVQKPYVSIKSFLASLNFFLESTSFYTYNASSKLERHEATLFSGFFFILSCQSFYIYDEAT